MNAGCILNGFFLVSIGYVFRVFVECATCVHIIYISRLSWITSE